MTPEQLSVGCALGSAAASFSAPLLDRWQPFGATLLRGLAVLFAAAAIVVFFWGQEGILVGVILAASLLALAASSYAQLQRLGSLRRDAERRADEAETEAALAVGRLAASEEKRQAAESVVNLLAGAAEGNDDDERQMLAIRKTVKAVRGLMREFDRIPESSLPPSEDWKGSYAPQLKNLAPAEVRLTENERAYRDALGDLNTLYSRGAPNSEHSRPLDRLRDLADIDEGRLDRLLVDRSNRLTGILSGLPKEP